MRDYLYFCNGNGKNHGNILQLQGIANDFSYYNGFSLIHAFIENVTSVTLQNEFLCIPFVLHSYFIHEFSFILNSRDGMS